MLEVEGQPICRQGEFIRLADGLAGSNEALTRWWVGDKTLHPKTLYAALNVGARLSAKDEETVSLVDQLCARLRDAFPELKLPAPG